MRARGLETCRSLLHCCDSIQCSIRSGMIHASKNSAPQPRQNRRTSDLADLGAGDEKAMRADFTRALPRYGPTYRDLHFNPCRKVKLGLAVSYFVSNCRNTNGKIPPCR